MTTQRVTADDLALAAAWLEAYDGGPDGTEETDAMFRVAAWLRKEVGRRNRRADEAAILAEIAATGRPVDYFTRRIVRKRVKAAYAEQEGD
jgi:hypothetical protein